MKKTLIALALTLAPLCAVANQGTMVCHTPRMAKTFTVENNSVTFFEEMPETGKGRAIASISNVRTRFEGQGYTKIVKFEGHKHMIHIENTNSFSEVDDYLLIRSKKGHEMTYPLTCSWK